MAMLSESLVWMEPVLMNLLRFPALGVTGNLAAFGAPRNAALLDAYMHTCLQAQAQQGGYRDLTICVLFEGAAGLRIIGEIQAEPPSLQHVSSSSAVEED